MSNILQVLLTRYEFQQKRTFGKFAIGGKVWDMVEDKDRGLKQEMTKEEVEKIKIKHETCIPYGKTGIILTHSQRFGVILPLVHPVNGFDGIRIHPGTTEHDTSGCLLPGIRVRDALTMSRISFFEVMEKILTHKTDHETAKKLVLLYQAFWQSKDAKYSKEIDTLYNAKKNNNTIEISIVKATENVVYKNN